MLSSDTYAPSRKPVKKLYWLPPQNAEDLSAQDSIAIGGLGGGFKYFLCSPLLGEMMQFD